MHTVKLRRRGIKNAVRWLAFVLAVYVGVSILGAAFSMRIPRLPLNESPTSVDLAFQDVVFPSRGDAISLKGWFIPGIGDSVLVIVHGGYQNRIDPIVDTLDLAFKLVNEGYNVLLFDLRGRGESGGRGFSLSNTDKDIGGAIDYLETREFHRGEIGIIGYCSGAAGACVFASREHIGGLVLDGCFTSVKNMVYNQASKRSIPNLPLDMFFPGLQLAAKVFYRYEVINPVDVVSSVACPIFFIHEEDDDLISMADVEELARASSNPANKIWEVDGAAHSQSFQTHSGEYVKRVSEFFRGAFETSEQLETFSR